jgi:ubiquinone/menaquinone biosynthesis C-methylase UbiE
MGESFLERVDDMKFSDTNRFQEFFKESKYIFLKNYLYNYLLRKKAVNQSLKNESLKLILEVGSGISPMVTGSRAIIYSDLSFTALEILRKANKNGGYVVADGMDLPFKADVFTHTVCSEVLEHLADDRKALKELYRVMKPAAMLVATFPHRKFYFANDDRFVNHYRRYEISEMKERLKSVGLKLIDIKKVLGPFEKLTMSLAVYGYSIIQKLKLPVGEKKHDDRLIKIAAYVFRSINLVFMVIAWLDAKIMPRMLSTVILVKAKKCQIC